MEILVYVWSDPDTCTMRIWCKSWDDAMAKIELAGNQFPVFVHNWNGGVSIDITVGE